MVKTFRPIYRLGTSNNRSNLGSENVFGILLDNEFHLRVSVLPKSPTEVVGLELKTHFNGLPHH
jgi:hypothetical protein